MVVLLDNSPQAGGAKRQKISEKKVPESVQKVVQTHPEKSLQKPETLFLTTFFLGFLKISAAQLQATKSATHVNLDRSVSILFDQWELQLLCGWNLLEWK